MDQDAKLANGFLKISGSGVNLRGNQRDAQASSSVLGPSSEIMCGVYFLLCRCKISLL
jgi:hypothetical protein